MRILSFFSLALFFSTLTLPSAAQKTHATVAGRLLDENDKPLAGVSVIILGRQTGLVTSDSGTFRIKVPAQKAFGLVFSFTGYRTEQRNFLLNDNEEERIVVRLERSATPMQQVIVSDQRERRQTGLILVNPKYAINIPTPVGGIESLLKVFVGSNNELTSQYAVRGGNYDENLVYINDFEVFRPYLVSNAQQEGISIIDPEMTRSVSFYTGGFESRYGDKMSSALDIQYRRPTQFGGSVYIGLLEQGLHLEGTAGKKFTYLIGLRNRTNGSLVGSQETKGTYAPSSSDIQAQLSWRLNNSWQLELLGILSQTRFNFTPQFSQLTSSIFSPYYTANLGLDTYFEGQEKDRYGTNMIGLSLSQQVNPRLRLKWMVSRFEDKEQQNYDITGAYLFGDRDFDKSSPSFGQITNPLGAGTYQNFARDNLDIAVWNATHKGYLTLDRHYLQWGISAERQLVNDHLHEWQYQDSAGYSLPYTPGIPSVTGVVNGQDNPGITRLTGYVQDNLLFNDSGSFTLQGGARYNYNTLNREFLVSPRLGASWKPRNSKKDIIYKAAIGIYDQPPFFREMLRPDGSLNTRLKAQRSWQAVIGFDKNFHIGDRPFRFTTEAYYKSMTRVNPYDIDNVKIQYFALNDAKAYATGVEFRLFGQLVKDADSWISMGFMRAMEKIDTFYYNYTLDSLGHPLDSARTPMGWVRRPSDRLFTFGLFLQDYLATNKNLKAYLNLLYGSNLPFSIPGNLRYRDALTIDPYIRIDVGFSALLLDSEKGHRRSHNPFRGFDNIWASLEIFNLIDRANTISYMLIKDFSNTTYAIPERLTPRLINLKLIGRF